MNSACHADTPPSRVFAVVVAYSPEPSRFSRLLAAAEKQVARIVVADNGGGVGLETVAWSEHVERIDMEGNVGVAAAINVGMRYAFARGATHVLLFDHDSEAAPEMTSELLRVWEEKTSAGFRVAAVGANHRDRRRPSASPFLRVSGWRLHRLVDQDDKSASLVSYVISAGSLISREAFDTVGGMNESLFIDYVDVEWGIRAGVLGWKCFGAWKARMGQALGEDPLVLLGKAYPLHSPLRHYYMVRNIVWLITRTRYPASWKFVEGWRMLRFALTYSMFAPMPHQHIAAMTRGFRDGVRGRLGPARPGRCGATV